MKGLLTPLFVLLLTVVLAVNLVGRTDAVFDRANTLFVFGAESDLQDRLYAEWDARPTPYRKITTKDEFKMTLAMALELGATTGNHTKKAVLGNIVITKMYGNMDMPITALDASIVGFALAARSTGFFSLLVAYIIELIIWALWALIPLMILGSLAPKKEATTA